MTEATEKYAHLVTEGEITASLTREEKCAVLLAYDVGSDCLQSEDYQALQFVIAKLKSQIWP